MILLGLQIGDVDLGDAELLGARIERLDLGRHVVCLRHFEELLDEKSEVAKFFRWGF